MKEVCATEALPSRNLSKIMSLMVQFGAVYITTVLGWNAKVLLFWPLTYTEMALGLKQNLLKITSRAEIF